MKRGPMVLLLVGILVLGTAAAPPPRPTAVIPGLGQQIGSDGRYYSTTAPFSLHSTWTGSTYKDANGLRDRLRLGTRYIDIVSFTNDKKFNTSTLNVAARAALQQSGFSPRVAQVLTINRQHVPVFVFADTSGSYAESVFILAGRAWVFALITDGAHAGTDVRDFSQTMRSFRLEHAGAGN